MALGRIKLLGGAILCAGLLADLPAAAQSAPGRVIYCCDVNGQQVCGDILPKACYGRAYREINPSGTVRRYVAAPMSPEEVAQRRAEERRQRAEYAAQLKQQRLDEALLETYRDLADLDNRRDREINALDRSLQLLREREVELVERQNELIALAARTGTRDQIQASQLEDDIRNLDREILSQRSVIDAKLRERSAVLDRFDEDRQRYIELTMPAADSVTR